MIVLMQFNNLVMISKNNVLICIKIEIKLMKILSPPPFKIKNKCPISISWLQVSNRIESLYNNSKKHCSKFQKN